MGEFLVSKFPGWPAAHRASIALDKLQSRGATIYAWAVVSRTSEDRISVLDRKEYPGQPATVAAFIGALAGLAVGPVTAATGAIGGGLIGLAARAIERDSRSRLLGAISHEIERSQTVLIVEVAPQSIASLEVFIGHCGGKPMHTSEDRSTLLLQA